MPKPRTPRKLLALKEPLAEPVLPPSTMVRGRIPSVGEDWVRFTQIETEKLAKHLDRAAIDELAGACGITGALYHARRANPISLSAIKVHLLRVSEVAEELSHCLELNSRHALTLVSLLEHECHNERGMKNSIELTRLLKALSVGSGQQARLYSGQARRQTPEYQVRCIARVLEPKGIKISAAPGSRFVRLVRICFEAMGIHIDPGRAIRSYLSHKDDESFTM